MACGRRSTGLASISTSTSRPSIRCEAMQALVMAGGLGSRLRPLTDEVPKPLLPIGGRPILELILRQLRHAGVEEAFISLGYKAELIRAYIADGRRLGLRVRYVDEPTPLGTAGALGYVKDEVREPLL